MYKRYKNGYWYIRTKVDGGHECFRSLGIKWKHDAEMPSRAVVEKAAEILAAFRIELAQDKGGNIGRHLPPTLESLEKIFWERKSETTIAPGTRAQYVYCWATLRRLLSPIELPTTKTLRQFVVRRKAEKVRHQDKLISGKTVKEELRTFFSAWKMALEEGMRLPPKPAYPDNFHVRDDMDRAKKGKKRGAKTIRRFIAALPNQEGKDRIWLCALTGLRWAETNRIHLGRLYRAKPGRGIHAFLLLPPEATKERRERLIGLTRRAYRIVRRNWPFASRNNRKQIEGASKRLGIVPYLHCRDMRHSFATACVNRGVSQTHVDLVMGHLDGTNKRYQSQTHEAAAKVARAAERWLMAGKARRGMGGESAKVVDFEAATEMRQIARESGNS